MSWQHVLGHDAAVASFSAAWKRGRLGHAYLFVGLQGIGKFTFAKELAKAVLCENRGSKFDACDQCASCKLMDAGTHPDFFTVARPEDKNVLPIALIRGEEQPKTVGLLEKLSMKPARGTRKVAIVDDADDLNPEAANSFLKTLEEPAPGSLLLLIGGPTEETQMPTIRSRSQITHFMPLASGLMKRVLSKHGITDALRQERLLQLAGGSPGQALALDDEEIWLFRKQLLQSLKQLRIDPSMTAKAWMEFIENAGKDAAAHRQRAALIFRLLSVMLKTALHLHVGSSSFVIDATEAQALRDFASRLGEEQLLLWLERALEADLQVERSVQLVLIIEAFLDAVCGMSMAT